MTANTRLSLHVLCFSPYPASGPSVRHRILGFAPYWSEEGIRLTLWPFMTARFYAIRRKFGWSATLEKGVYFIFCTFRLIARIPFSAKYDIVIIHRELFPLGPPWIEKALLKLCRTVVFDVDDAVWQPPSNAIDQRRLFWSPERFPTILSGCKHVVVGNGHLKAHVEQFNSQVTVIPTPYVDLSDTGKDGTPAPTKPVIVWIGNLGNAEYLNIVMPALEELADQFEFTLRLVGGEDINQICSEKVAIEYVSWSKEHEAGHLISSDIGIMPLYDRAYEQGKCSFKIIQYFSAGLPVVASAVGMNKEIIVEGENGYLAGSVEEWKLGLTKLLEDVAFRRAAGTQGYTAFTQRYTYTATTLLWLEVFGKLGTALNRDGGYKGEK